MRLPPYPVRARAHAFFLPICDTSPAAAGRRSVIQSGNPPPLVGRAVVHPVGEPAAAGRAVGHPVGEPAAAGRRSVIQSGSRRRWSGGRSSSRGTRRRPRGRVNSFCKKSGKTPKKGGYFPARNEKKRFFLHFLCN